MQDDIKSVVSQGAFDQLDNLIEKLKEVQGEADKAYQYLSRLDNTAKNIGTDIVSPNAFEQVAELTKKYKI